jgi:hypothetical protein
MLAGSQKKHLPTTGGKRSQRAAIIRIIWPLEKASTLPTMP